MSSVSVHRRLAWVYVGLAALAALIGWQVFGSGARPTSGVPIIRTDAEYQAINRQAKKLAEPIFTKIDAGKSLSSKESVDLLQAAMDWDGMSAFKPTEPATTFVAGQAYAALGENETASVRFRQFLAAAGTPQNQQLATMVADAHDLLSRCYFATGNYSLAVAEATTALQQRPDVPDYLVDRARANVQLKNITAATDDVLDALKLDPSNAKARGLADLLNL